MRASDEIARQYADVRAQSEALCAHLPVDDFGLQAMPETSPLKWHLAHVSWFFETFILEHVDKAYRPFDEKLKPLFNSYYNGIGKQHPRAQRHLLSRPTLHQVYAYRKHVDMHMLSLLEKVDPADEAGQRTILGLHHEAQHQELMLTDLKYNLACNPLFPAYLETELVEEPERELAFIGFDGGLVEIGAEGGAFCFDNELPRHRHWLEPFELASRPVSNGEYLAFIEDGGYHKPMLWLSDGWSARSRANWQHPLYWRQVDGEWYEFTLHGLRPLDRHRTAVHLSYYEADAFARWLGARLPSEQEWEHAASSRALHGQFRNVDHLHPGAGTEQEGIFDLFGGVWEWTCSPYTAYPGYRAEAGAIGEYNGKFMCNQMVLRGGSCVTPGWHMRRSSYRNFFYPQDCWQFSGVRLARDAGTYAGG